jgi:hypothetical protein
LWRGGRPIVTDRLGAGRFGIVSPAQLGRRKQRAGLISR